MAEQHADTGAPVRWSWVGRALVGLLAAGAVSVAIEAVRQGRINGEALASVMSELKIRVATAEEQNRSFVRRDELTEIVKRLDQTLTDLRADLREERRRPYMAREREIPPP